MLIVLSVSSSIPTQLLARGLRQHFMPDVAIDDNYSVRFSADTYEILDKAGEIVHRPGMISLLENQADQLSDQEANLVVMAAEKLYNDTILDTFIETRYGDAFSDPMRDFGIITDPSLYRPNTLGSKRYTLQDIVDGYNDHPRPVHVITDSFGKYAIDFLREQLGESNVFVLNVMRNPSAGLLTIKTHNDNAAAASPSVEHTTFQSKFNILVRSLHNNIVLMSDPMTTTVKYEDILKDGKVTVAGAEVDLSVILKNHNGLLSAEEHQQAVNGVLNVTNDELAHINNYLLNYNQLFVEEIIARRSTPDQLLQHINSIQQTQLTLETFFQTVPANTFEALGYSPLTREEIMAS